MRSAVPERLIRHAPPGHLSRRLSPIYRRKSHRLAVTVARRHATAPQKRHIRLFLRLARKTEWRRLRASDDRATGPSLTPLVLPPRPARKVEVDTRPRCNAWRGNADAQQRAPRRNRNRYLSPQPRYSARAVSVFANGSKRSVSRSCSMHASDSSAARLHPEES